MAPSSSSLLLLWLAPSRALVAPAASLRASAPASFEAWAFDSGIVAPKLRIDDDVYLRGVTVLEDIAAGEVLCEVPRRRCLDLAALSVDPSKAGRSPCESLAPTPLWARLAWYERLAVWLLAEARRGGASEICGYLDYLCVARRLTLLWGMRVRRPKTPNHTDTRRAARLQAVARDVRRLDALVDRRGARRVPLPPARGGGA